jgi:predicted ATP-grasp superfamily ATP-dependent carboligase
LVPIFEDEVAFVARNQDQLEQVIKIIPLPSIEQYQNLSNKALLSKILKQRSLPAPETVIYTRETTFIDQLRELKFPVLFKPSFSWGGRGIIKFSDIETLLDYIGENQFENHSFIVQSFIEGFNIDCNVLYQHGMLKAKCVQKSFVENNSYKMSPGIQFLNQNEIIELVDGFLSPYKYNGIAHIDLRFDNIEGKFKFIEINVRFWGTMLGSLISANVNFPLLTVFEAMGIPYETADLHEGCFMTFNNYLKYKFNNVLKNKKSQIMLKETSLEQLLADPAPKLYWMYSHLRHMVLK